MTVIDIDTIALWYNKAMFDESGIDYPDETWTWDTLVEAADILTITNMGLVVRLLAHNRNTLA